MCSAVLEKHMLIRKLISNKTMLNHASKNNLKPPYTPIPITVMKIFKRGTHNGLKAAIMPYRQNIDGSFISLLANGKKYQTCTSTNTSISYVPVIYSHSKKS